MLWYITKASDIEWTGVFFDEVKQAESTKNPLILLSNGDLTPLQTNP